MLRYKLRTLLMLLAILPPLLWIGWTKYEAWRAEQELQRALREQSLEIYVAIGISGRRSQSHRLRSSPWAKDW